MLQWPAGISDQTVKPKPLLRLHAGLGAQTSPSVLSISSLLKHHLSCKLVSRLEPYTSFGHHSPQLVKKICSGSAGRSFALNARRMLLAPANREIHWSCYRASIVLPSGMVLASGMSMDSFMFWASFVSGISPGDTATTVH